jgi:hypothetical protein
MGIRVPKEIEQRCLELAGLATPPPPEPVDDSADEKAFQKRVTDLASENGWDWYHVTIARKAKAGWPDLVLFKPGRPILFRELKTDAGRTTAAQERWAEIIRGAGGDWDCWRPNDWQTIMETLR